MRRGKIRASCWGGGGGGGFAPVRFPKTKFCCVVVEPLKASYHKAAYSKILPKARELLSSNLIMLRLL